MIGRSPGSRPRAKGRLRPSSPASSGDPYPVPSRSSAEYGPPGKRAFTPVVVYHRAGHFGPDPLAIRPLPAQRGEVKAFSFSRCAFLLAPRVLPQAKPRTSPPPRPSSDQSGRGEPDQSNRGAAFFVGWAKAQCAVPTTSRRARDGGHAALCPPYETSF